MYSTRKAFSLAKINQFRIACELLRNRQCKTYYTYSPEPSQPLNREPTFCSIEDAVKCVKSGNARRENIFFLPNKVC